MSGKLNLLKASWSFTSLAAKVGVIAVATTIGLANVVGSAGATLDAVATNNADGISPQSIQSGTLSLTLANGTGPSSGESAGFANASFKLRPADSFTRFVNLAVGDLEVASPTLKIVNTVSSILNDTTLGLKVLVKRCTVAYDTSGACVSPGVESLVIGTGTISSPISVAVSSVSGADLTGKIDVAASATNYLKYTISLPARNETIVNGSTRYAATATTYAAGNMITEADSVQSKSASLTWTFSGTQLSGSTPSE